VNRLQLKFQEIAFEDRRTVTPRVEISPADVHVWGFMLDTDRADSAHLAHYLSEEEQERATRLVSGPLRRRFMAAHAALRVVLSRYCGQDPKRLLIRRTSKGKPFLGDDTALRFNLTHSHGRALIAISGDRDVGIDLEKIRPEVDVVSLARRFLSDSDQAFITNGDPQRCHERFMQIWVAREAVLKAEGEGITFPLHHDHFRFSSDGTEAYLIRGRDESKDANVPIRFLTLESGWVGAVAAEGTSWTVKYWDSAEC
jgi:4'-phosphopantetheinyl transferase